MSAFDIFGFVALLGLTWLWYDSMQARAVALREASAACAAEGMQFLDESIAIARVGLARDDDGQLKLRRIYGFDFSANGSDRHRGSIVMLGQTPLAVGLDPP